MSILAGKSRQSLIKSLGVTIGSSNYRHRSQILLTMPARNPGDVTQITAKCELTNSLGITVMVGCYIGFGRTSSAGLPSLSLPRTFDISNQGHFRLEEEALIMDDDLDELGLPLNLPAGWVTSFVLYAASDSSYTGATLKVESPGYSEMWYTQQ